MSTPPTLLLVDDVETNLDFLLAIFKDYDTIPVLSGREALDIAKTETIDLVLLDIVMPEMDGITVCQEMKATPEGQGLPVIFITASHDEETIVKAYQAGGIDYVVKPFRPIELLSRVETHLQLSRFQKEQQEMLFKQSKLAIMGEMMGNIAHQWIQPLSAISATAQEMQQRFRYDEKLDPQSLDQECERIIKSAKFAQETVRLFRRFMKDSNFKRRFRIRNEIDQIIHIMQPELRHAEIQTHVEMDPELFLHENPNEFGQIILNLISNAKDAIISSGIDSGYISITETLHEDQVEIKVEDNGGGINQDIFPQLFKEKVTTKGEKGSGIGLTLAHQIMTERMHGTITASNTSEGACFTLTFPPQKEM